MFGVKKPQEVPMDGNVRVCKNNTQPVLFMDNMSSAGLDIFFHLTLK